MVFSLGQKTLTHSVVSRGHPDFSALAAYHLLSSHLGQHCLKLGHGVCSRSSDLSGHQKHRK